MGTGKTLPIIELMQDAGNHIVIAPAFLLRNWRNEIAKFTKENAAIFPAKARITLVSQDRVYKPELVPIFAEARYVTVDESHGFSTMTSRRSKALHALVEKYKPERLHLLTGTPVKNRIPELYSLLRLIDYGYNRGFRTTYRGQHSFSTQYCQQMSQRIRGHHIIKFYGERNLKELKEQWLEKIYIRQRLEDLALVPDVVYESVQADADKVEKDTDELLEQGWRAMEAFTKPPEAAATAKKLSAIAKASWTAAYANQMLEADEESLVIFSDHVDPCKNIADALASHGVGTITGATPMAERQAIVDRFQAGTTRVIVGTIGACGTGITLTRAKTVIFNDLSYVPSQNAQAVGRLRRIGQKSTVVAVRVCRPGIDERISEQLVTKERTIASVLGE